MRGPTYVIYSHTEFLDLLQITCDYLNDIDDKVLIINESDTHSDLYKNFKDVVFYDDTLAYTDKVSDALKKIDSEYILFTHEVDVPLKRDDTILNKFTQLMDLKSIDRIDLQPNGGNSGKYIKIVRDDDVIDWPNVDLAETSDDDMCLGHHTDPHTYMFNVNPSIWRRSAIIDIFTKFNNKGYRDVEYADVQNYCSKFKIYNLYSRNHTLRCGYMNSLPLYKYLHITHYRRLLRFGHPWLCEFGWSYTDASIEYTEIVDKYNLRSCGRPFS